MTPTQTKALRRLTAGIFLSLGLTPFLGCEGYVVVDCSGEKPGPDGLVDCSGILKVRPNPVTCDLPTGSGTFATCDVNYDCATDMDCNALPHGRCDNDGSGACMCHYGCESDKDCGPNMACLCGDKGGQCVIATCKTSADCGEGQSCALYQYYADCGSPLESGFACTSDHDECLNSAQCGGSQCVSYVDHFVCAGDPCAIGGRPFFVHEELRLAEVVPSRAWSADVAPEVARLSPAVRAASTARWTEVGRLEHASVASFARFAMQLLSLGAPPELIEQTTSAMADETVHARLAFGLASAYSGAPVGPGDLPIQGAMDRSDVATIVRTLIHEGCVGETFAAIVAREERERASDPVVSKVLSRIVADEEKHALLSWRALAWLLDRGGDEARGALSVEIERFAAEAAEWQSPAADRSAEPEDGALSDAEMKSLRKAVLREVFLPSARALCRSAEEERANPLPLAEARA